jgi:hypothetical protein
MKLRIHAAPRAAITGNRLPHAAAKATEPTASETTEAATASDSLKVLSLRPGSSGYRPERRLNPVRVLIDILSGDLRRFHPRSSGSPADKAAKPSGTSIAQVAQGNMSVLLVGANP